MKDLQKQIDDLFDECSVTYYKSLMPAIREEEAVASYNRTRTLGQRNAAILCDKVTEMVSIILALQQQLKERDEVIKGALREVVNMIEGNYPNPRTNRPNKCEHGTEYWQECEGCNDAQLQRIRTVLAAALPKEG